ncbi:hypothetical protein SK128_002344 [Halocaridina rubra]|uniref:Uncharacterized protein n=1 Tax=Halocaridina rubra TaxID=373956 RepID=A0AAN9ABI4_HALRR
MGGIGCSSLLLDRTHPSPGKKEQCRDNKKASSLPNILDCGREADGNGNMKSKPGGDGTKSRRSLAPAIDLPKLRLPRLSRGSDKAKAKTTSLPKIGCKTENMVNRSHEWSEVWSGNGSDAEGICQGSGNIGSSMTPTLTSTPTTLPSPQPPPPTPHTPTTPDPPNTPATPQIPRDTLQNSWGTLAGKDPRKDSGIRSRRSSIQAQSLTILLKFRVPSEDFSQAMHLQDSPHYSQSILWHAFSGFKREAHLYHNKFFVHVY